MNLDTEFKEAVECVALLGPQSNRILLKLYGLYKQATVGDVQGDRPGATNFRGRAKYDAWAERKGMSPEDAKRQYIEYADTIEA